MSPSLEQTLYFTMGLPGAGKSHFSARLARGMTDCILVDVDKLRPDIYPEATFSQIEHLTVYGVLAGYALAHLQQKRTVILDGKYNTSDRRQLPLTIARSTGARCMALWLEVPEDVGIRRIHSREYQWRESPEIALQRMRAAFENPAEEERRNLTVARIDGTATFEAQYQQLLTAKKPQKTR